MSHLESLISKYLDGELTSDELAELRRVLAADPDALPVYREMMAIRRAARGTSTRRAPSAMTEMHLFERLRREGLHAPGAHAAGVGTATSIERSMFARRAGAVAAVLVASVIAIISFVPSSDVETPRLAVATQSSATLRGAPAGHSAVSPSDRAPEPAAKAIARRDRIDDDATTARAVDSRPRRSIVVDRHDRDEAFAPAVDSAIAPAEDIGRRPAAFAEDPPALAAAVDSIAQAPEPSAPALLPVPGALADRDAILSASLRYGNTWIAEASNRKADDLSIGVDVDLGGGHRLALVGGRSAAVTELRAVNTHSVPARTSGVLGGGGKDDGGPRLARSEEAPAPVDLEVSQEWWGGIGYSISLPVLESVELGPGVRAGLGARSLHLGAEVPVRVKVARAIAVEFVPSVAHIVPHDRARDEYAIESASDGFLYDAEREQTSFTTYGLAIGLRVTLD